MFDFLYWLFFVGILIAAFQDLTRREVDNWLNLLLLFSSFGFLVFKVVLGGESLIIWLGIFSLLVTFILANLFYYGHVFAGGDAKLIFAMAALFVGMSFFETLTNIAWFVVALLLSGSIYGLVYGGVLFGLNFEKCKKKVKEKFENVYIRYLVVFGIMLFVLSYFDFMFLFFSIFVLLGGLIYVFAKAVEDVAMIKEVGGNALREGDWLVKDVRVKERVIKADWEGLSKNDLKLLKNKKKIKIKGGMPFVPAFFVALVVWGFREWVLGWLEGLV